MVLEFVQYGDLRAVLKDLARKNIWVTNCELLKCIAQVGVLFVACVVTMIDVLSFRGGPHQAL